MSLQYEPPLAELRFVMHDFLGAESRPKFEGQKRS